jgi:hypothetical protein
MRSIFCLRTTAFGYYDGNLTTMGGANWSGAATSEITAESGALKIVGGTGTVAYAKVLAG